MALPRHITVHKSPIPNQTGVYLFKDNKSTIIYVGRATSLKKRVSSYFTKARDAKTEALVKSIASLTYIATESLLEAIFKEAELIKKYQPKYNIDQKDDKSFIFLLITKEAYPRALMARGRELEKMTGSYQAVFGPFISAKLLQSLLKLVRKMIPFSACKPPSSNNAKPCFYYHLGQCAGVCIGKISSREYQKIIRNLVLFFQGKKKRVARNLKCEMEQLSKQEKFEAAAKIRNQLYNLEHINDMVLLRRESPPRTSFKRIEGYDISHISGTSATGSMVVFENGKPNKAEYRKFRIKTIQGAHDTGMMQEVLARRLKHTEWKYPNLILIDGGTPQINAAFLVLKQHGLPIPVVGLAKGPHRKKVDLYFGNLNNRTKQHIKTIKESLIKVRNEAHRFALSYHRYLRLKRHRIRG